MWLRKIPCWTLRAKLIFRDDVLHCVFLQTLAVCSPGQRNLYITKSLQNVAALENLHSGVYLGKHRGYILHAGHLGLSRTVCQCSRVPVLPWQSAMHCHAFMHNKLQCHHLPGVPTSARWICTQLALHWPLAATHTVGLICRMHHCASCKAYAGIANYTDWQSVAVGSPCFCTLTCTSSACTVCTARL